jgi:hypothetical protein
MDAFNQFEVFMHPIFYLVSPMVVLIAFRIQIFTTN